MSKYHGQFAAMICCGIAEADQYISDMVLEIKRRVRTLADTPFSVRLRIQDASGQTYEMDTDETEGFSCPDELCGCRCTEIPAEVFCEASCDPELLKAEVHQAIIDSSDIHHMTPFFYREDVTEGKERGNEADG